MTTNEDQHFTIQIKKTPKQYIDKLPKNVAKRIITAIDKLADDPYPIGSRKLESFESLYRIRIGDWRVIYAIDDDILLILVVEVGSRGDVYRNL